MIVIGVDVHKRTHTLAAVDAVAGRQIAQQQIQATDAGRVDAIRFAENDGLNWPHCDGLNWPHLRPIVA